MDKWETVTIIRALLSSSAVPVTISKLNREFKNETGLDIPLYGHASLDSFLYSIPETVVLSGEYPDQVVGLVESCKSSHVVSLVQRQKNPQRRLGKEKQSRLFDSVQASSKGFKCDWENCMNFREAEIKQIHTHLLLHPEGCSFDELKILVQRLPDLTMPLKQHNILGLLKLFPFCVYYNEKFYAVEVFKHVLLS